MSGSPWKRIAAASLIAIVCLLAVPATSHAATSWRSGDLPVTKFWTRLVDWLTSVWPGTSVQAPATGKFGAGHSSDGRVPKGSC